ncbi:MAG: N-acetylneuraminate synthase family protein [Clostridia bacterium]|nr:N-acetylneuraminate synthase family protein [Clostridia bacterium]
MGNYIQIGNRKIGPDYEPLIIAEIATNHYGDLQIAKDIVDVAHSAGIEVIKHQTHIPEKELTPLAKEIFVESINSDLYDWTIKCSLNEDDERALKEYVEREGMIFISAPFSFEAVDRLERMHIPAYRISSTQMNNFPLVEYIASKRKPILLSTGMNDIPNIRKAIDVIKKYHDQYAIMHCTNIYPTPPDKVSLSAIDELRKAFPGVVLGLSDHTLNNNSSYAAMTLGVSIIEKHFTDSKNRIDQDAEWSMTKPEAMELISFSKEIDAMKKGKKKTILKEEKDKMEVYFNTIVTTRKIRKGSIITRDKITTKGPNKLGIKAEDMYKILWKKVNKDIEENYHIDWDDIDMD